MPLDKSGSKASIGKNIATEERAGKPPAQAKAIAESEYRAHHHPHSKSPEGKRYGRK